MFHELRIENYKAWRGAHRLRLAPITLLLGRNSAGKTSLLQPLLVLKQTVEGADRRIALNLGGQDSDLVHAGRFLDDIVSKGARPRQASFGFDLDRGANEVLGSLSICASRIGAN